MTRNRLEVAIARYGVTFLNFKTTNFRQHPELDRMGRGEQGVLLVEPCRSEILPHRKLKNPELARESADKIYSLFLTYKAKGNFVKMDMARKFYK